jgi:hypothetical protein
LISIQPVGNLRTDSLFVNVHLEVGVIHVDDRH